MLNYQTEVFIILLYRLIKCGIRVHLDNNDIYSPGWKYNHWEQKGVPLRIEVGFGEIEKSELLVVERINRKKTRITNKDLE